MLLLRLCEELLLLNVLASSSSTDLPKSSTPVNTVRAEPLKPRLALRSGSSPPSPAITSAPDASA